jgi:HAD superfamily hydrolase (TIGR01490 family)
MTILFDLDGTILPWDTQKLFCNYVVRKYPMRKLFLLVYILFLPLAPILGSEGLKRVFLSFLWGFSEEEVDKLAGEFARLWLPDKAWQEMLAEIQQHQQAGDFLILVSASPELYVKEIATILGFHLAIGTEILANKKTYSLFPDLQNNKGQNKVIRLKKILNPSMFSQDGKLKESHGYTDSCADLPMLAICQSATVVNPNEKLLAIATEKNWEVIHLTKPWKNPFQRLILRVRCVFGANVD